MSTRKAGHETYQLSPPTGLDGLRGYVFTDEQHAREWMAQRFTKGYRARAVIVYAPPGCTCGGARIVVRDRSRPDLEGPDAAD